jgi:hypothetical protein
MWWKCEEKLFIDRERSHASASTVRKHWSHFYNLSKPYLIEKSIANTARMLFFEKEFESPFFVHIIRNGYSVAEGIYRKAIVMEGNPIRPLRKYPMEYCIRQWTRSIEVVERDRLAVKNFIEVRYEDLTERPFETINMILSFLNLQPLEQHFFTRTFRIHDNDSRIKNMNDESLARLTEKDLNIINSMAEETMMKYGYSIRSS